MNTLTIAIILTVYLVSLFRCRWWVKAAHTKPNDKYTGRWGNLTIEGSDMFICIMPLLNTVFMFVTFFYSPYKSHNNTFVKSFFGIKNNQ